LTPGFRRDALLEVVDGISTEVPRFLQHDFYGSLLQTPASGLSRLESSQKTHIAASELMLEVRISLRRFTSRGAPSRLEQIKDFDQALATSVKGTKNDLKESAATRYQFIRLILF
jgi:hypothetical protein